METLKRLHKRTKFTAKSGANGDPESGTQGPKRMKRTRRKAQDLRIGVPPGADGAEQNGVHLFFPVAYV